jgi:hypothetical protein
MLHYTEFLFLQVTRLALRGITWESLGCEVSELCTSSFSGFSYK